MDFIKAETNFKGDEESLAYTFEEGLLKIESFKLLVTIENLSGSSHTSYKGFDIIEKIAINLETEVIFRYSTFEKVGFCDLRYHSSI
jgi:hypothetical protein